MKPKEMIKRVKQSDLGLIASTRNREALSLAMEGKTFAEIGRQFKVSGSQAANLAMNGIRSIKKVKFYEKLDRDPDAVNIVMLLPVSFVFSGVVAGALQRCGFERVGDMMLHISNERQALHRLRGIGNKGISQIEYLATRFSLPWKAQTTFRWALWGDEWMED